MPKTQQSNSRSQSQTSKQRALQTRLENRIKKLKEDGMSSAEIREDSQFRELSDKIQSLSDSREYANRRRNDGGRTPTRGSGLSMNKGGLVKSKKAKKLMAYAKGGMVKANCGASMKPNGKSRG